jgi:hypothetical protein
MASTSALSAFGLPGALAAVFFGAAFGPAFAAAFGGLFRAAGLAGGALVDRAIVGSPG